MNRGKKSRGKGTPIERIFREEARREMTSNERRVLLRAPKKNRKKS
jgi:hypothetical protein